MHSSDTKKSGNIPAVTLLILSILIWSTGIGIFLNTARAAAISTISDTISDSDLGATANHWIEFTTPNDVPAGQTITVRFDPSGAAFDLSTLNTNDITATSGMTLVGVCGAGGDEVTAVISTSTDTITFTVCATDTVTSGNIGIFIGNNKIVNPNSEQSFVVRITAGPSDSGDTRVAIVNDVTMSASVETSFQFTIAGVAAGQNINDETATTSTTTTATAINFETINPNVAEVGAQQLSVATNAQNGFMVTVFQDGNLRSMTGADIDLFVDADATSTPKAWEAPANILDQENTYGHYGITSEDDVNANEFGSGSALYAGNLNSAREVFSHTGPADGTTANKGRTRVAIKIEISNLQEAANDYNNVLTYIATPTF